MSYDLVGWLIGIGGVISAVLAIKSRNKANAKAKEVERRVDAISNAKGVKDEVDAMGDESLLHSASKWLRNRD